MVRAAFNSGREADALDRRARRYFKWRAGTRKAAKRAYNRRARRASREVI